MLPGDVAYPAFLRPLGPVQAPKNSEKSEIDEKTRPLAVRPRRRIGLTAELPLRPEVRNHETGFRRRPFGQSKVIAPQSFQRSGLATRREISQKFAAAPRKHPTRRQCRELPSARFRDGPRSLGQARAGIAPAPASRISGLEHGDLTLEKFRLRPIPRSQKPFRPSRVPDTTLVIGARNSVD